MLLQLLPTPNDAGNARTCTHAGVSVFRAPSWNLLSLAPAQTHLLAADACACHRNVGVDTSSLSCQPHTQWVNPAVTIGVAVLPTTLLRQHPLRRILPAAATTVVAAADTVTAVAAVGAVAGAAASCAVADIVAASVSQGRRRLPPAIQLADPGQHSLVAFNDSTPIALAGGGLQRMQDEPAREREAQRCSERTRGTPRCDKGSPVGQGTLRGMGRDNRLRQV
eukprot:364365-Chlamydomonas_euryale.AAC.5